jgi:hypothetical protein
MSDSGSTKPVEVRTLREDFLARTSTSMRDRVLDLARQADRPMTGYEFGTRLYDSQSFSATYEALYELEKAGHLVSWWEDWPDAPAGGPHRRRVYQFRRK